MNTLNRNQSRPEVLADLKQIQVYQTRPDGVFVGYTVADESPLAPGDYLIPGGCVLEEPPEFKQGYQARWDQSSQSWSIEPLGTPAVVPLGSIPTIATYRDSVGHKIERTAGERRYDSAASIASYVGSTDSAWAAEAAAFVAWRDAVWKYAHHEFDRFETGERAMVSPTEFLLELPKIEWPER